MRTRNRHPLHLWRCFACLFLPTVARAMETRLTWVNGIAHALEDMAEGQQFISKVFGNKPVVYCYNPTSMAHQEDVLGYLSDLTQAGTQKLGRITQEVDTLVQHLRVALSSVGKNGLVIHIAHSQGALITSLAAQQLTPLEMSKIEIIAFGGAAALRSTVKTPFRRTYTCQFDDVCCDSNFFENSSPALFCLLYWSHRLHQLLLSQRSTAGGSASSVTGSTLGFCRRRRVLLSSAAHWRSHSRSQSVAANLRASSGVGSRTLSKALR